ncbi:hypothetical protein PISMIDRAFT_679021, partial [Pisolithus microcarpus 441]
RGSPQKLDTIGRECCYHGAALERHIGETEDGRQGRSPTELERTSKCTQTVRHVWVLLGR